MRKRSLAIAITILRREANVVQKLRPYRQPGASRLPSRPVGRAPRRAARFGACALAAFMVAVVALALMPVARAAVTAPGYAVAPFATGFVSSGSVGPVGIAFDASGALFVGNYRTGFLYKFGSAGGVVSPSTQVNTAPILGTPIAGLAFTKDGHLYLARNGANDVVELALSNGTVIRTIASKGGPLGLATDPLSGDLFVSGDGAISRISNFASGPGTIKVYALVGADGLEFGPDGTLYAAGGVGCGGVVKIAGTNSATPGAFTCIASVPSIDGLAVSANPSTPFLYCNRNDGIITKVDLSTTPPTLANVVTGGSRGDFVAVGFDGCLYATQTNSVIKVTNADGSCLLPPLGPLFPSNPPPEANPLTASKTATPSFTRTFGWSIAKSVDKTEVEIAAGGSATFTYAVAVTHDSGTDSNWQVTGTITAANQNTAPVAGVTVTDSINDANAVCTVTGVSGVTIPASSSSTFPYSCTYSATPASSSETNTATVTWSAQTLSNGQSLSAGSAMGTASIDWGIVTPTVVDGSVSVTDTFGGSLGTVSYTDSSPKTFTYPITFSGDPGGTCTSHDNTATFTTSTTGTMGSASKTVKACVGLDLTVSKTATPSLTRTYIWSIFKSASPPMQTINAGGTAAFNYMVTVAETGFTDSNWMVSGAITVTNPNDWEAITLTNVIDAVDNGGTCIVTGNTGTTILTLGSVTLSYTCSYASAPSSSSGTNTATATWDSTTSHTPDGSAVGTAGFTFNDGSNGNPQKVNQVVTATDKFNGGAPTTLGTLTASDSTPFTATTYVYSHTLSGVSGNCTAYSNTAMLVETGQTASATVTLCVVPSSVVPPSTVTNSAFCTITGNVNLIYVQGGSGTYQLTVSNPGQFYENIFFVGAPGDSVSVSAQLPYPFVTSGARPIQLSSAQVSNPSTNSCLVPNFDNQTPLTISGTKASGAPIVTPSSNGYLIVTLGAYDVSTPSPAPMGTHVTLMIAGTIPSTGFLYLTIHLNYGLKGTTGWTPSPSGCTLSGAGANCNAVNTSPAVTISYGQTYTFPVTITDTTTPTTITQSPSVSTVNTFKKDPGFTGSAFFTADSKVVS